MKKLSLLAVSALMLMSCQKNVKATVQELFGNGNDTVATDTVVEEEVRPEVVELTTLQRRTVTRDITLPSNLMAYETVNISPSLTGKIEHIYHEIGDRVSKGDSLVRMDRQQYNTACLTLANLQVERTRLDCLIVSGATTQQQIDQMALQIDQTEENLRFLRTNTFVKAPISGVVSAKNYEDGELYSGQAILTLLEVDRLKTLVAIPESYLPLIKKGQKLALTADVYKDRTFPATVEVVYPTVDAQTHTFQAKVVVDNGHGLLRPGMYVKTNFALGTASVITAPYSAVLKLIGANDRYIFINDNGKAKRVTVEMGQRFGDDVEISGEGIHEGVEMVTKGEAKLIDGTPIEISK